MGLAQGVGDRQHPGEDLLRRPAAQAPRVASVDMVHCDVGAPRPGVKAEHLDDVRVVEAPYRKALTLQQSDALGAGAIGEQLDDDRLVASPVSSQPDVGHSTAPDAAQ